MNTLIWFQYKEEEEINGGKKIQDVEGAHSSKPQKLQSTSEFTTVV